MPDSKLSQLTSKDIPAAEDLVLVTDVSTGQSKKTTAGGIANLVPAASTSVAGKVQMAQDSDITAGTNETKAVNPKQVKTALDAKADSGDVDVLETTLAQVKIAADYALSQFFR